jgi:hypothetical protein
MPEFEIVEFNGISDERVPEPFIRFHFHSEVSNYVHQSNLLLNKPLLEPIWNIRKVQTEEKKGVEE